MEYGISGCTAVGLRGSVGKWLGQCDIRSGSRIQDRAGNGAGGPDSVEKDRGTDPQHGQIAATPTGTRPLVATPWCHASWIPRGHCVHTECLADPQCFPAGPHAVHGWI